MGQEKKSGVKTAIIILAVLLSLSAAALVGVYVYGRLNDSSEASVSVPDNIITQSSVSSESGSLPSSEPVSSPEQDKSSLESKNETASSETAPAPEKAQVISLYEKNAGCNLPFNTVNMFPGDTESRYYCVRVSHKDTVTVNYRADIRSGYEKLSEVLRVHIAIPETGQTLYDGLMRDMPESLQYTLAGANEQDDLFYKITAYLDTSVGNEYQNLGLVADFRWWVAEEDNLAPLPRTSDAFSSALWVVLAASAGAILLLLIFARRKREDKHEG